MSPKSRGRSKPAAAGRPKTAIQASREARAQPAAKPAAKPAAQPKPAPAAEPRRREKAWTRGAPGTSYPQALRDAGTAADDRNLVSIGTLDVLIGIAGYLAAYYTVSHAVTALGWLASGRPGGYMEYYQLAVAGFATPWGLWAAHLALGSMIVVCWLVYRLHHRRKLAWLWSVGPGVRWRYGLAALGVAAVVFGGYAAFEFATGSGSGPAPGWGWYLLAVVLTAPLQAAGEEVLFRGLLVQALGLVFRRPWAPIALSAVVFAVFHGSQDVWMFLSRFAFGLVAGALVWRTGGLEAGIAAHAVNNVLAFSLALASGTLTDVRTQTEAGPLVMVGEVGLFAVFAALAWGLAALLKVRNTVADEA
jgi:membrane protease YdiL (CAAX protease family)